MDIVLDSNIFRSDIPLRTTDIDVLLDYLKKTGSSIILPQIILDEIKGLYAKALNDRVSEFNKAIKNLKLLFLTSYEVNLPPIVIEEEVKKYEEFVKKRLLISDNHILKYNNNFLPMIAERGINRIKPSGEKGQGFRDTLIWLTIKEYCRKCHERQITFISNNSDDFAAADKSTLHESLDKECQSLGIKINYFKTLKDFIEIHSTKIDFINYDWITEKMDFPLVSDLTLEKLSSQDYKVRSWFQNVTGNTCISFLPLSVTQYDDADLFVYEMVDNRLVVNYIMRAEVEVEFIYYHDGRTFRHRNNDEIEFYNERRKATMIKNIDTAISVTMTIEERNVLDLIVSDLDY